MWTMLAATWSFIRGEEGAAVIEYALALMLLLALTIAAIAAMGTTLSAVFDAASTSI